MNLEINNLEKEYNTEAKNIFSKAFVNDTLHLYAFPETEERKKITELVYDFMVMHIVPEMNLKMKGAFVDKKLAGAIIYTPYIKSENKFVWTEKLDSAVKEMWSKAKNENIKLIGEYAMTSMKYKPKNPHVYLNELAVLPEMHSKGIGTSLIKSVESEYSTNPYISGFGLDTSNIKNVRLYKKLGYEVINEFDFYELKGYCMFKSIRKLEDS